MLPFDQHLLSSNIHLLGYWYCHPPPGNFHSLWVFCNQVVHDWTVDGLAHAAELHISEELHTQFALGLQDLPAIYRTPLHQRTLCGLPPACSSHGLPMMACWHCHCPSNRPPAMPSRDPIYASCTPYLPSPSSTTPWKLNFIWALAFFLPDRDGWNTSHHQS